MFPSYIFSNFGYEQQKMKSNWLEKKMNLLVYITKIFRGVWLQALLYTDPQIMPELVFLHHQAKFFSVLP